MQKKNNIRVVLVNPIADSQQLSNIHRRLLPPVPAMGLCSIAAILEKNDFEVHIIDQYASGLNNKQLLCRINILEPDVIGFSCLTPAFPNVKKLCRSIRLLGKNPKIVMGNLHPTLFADEILQQGIADVIVRGEGEYTILELVSAIHTGSDFSNINGISYRCGKSIVHNKDRGPIECLDDLPYPAWHLLDWKNYAKAPMLGLKGPTVLIQASRGCPFKCIFCAQDKVHNGFRVREVTKVVDEIEYICHHLNIYNFVFGDSIFPSTAEIGYKFCDELIKRQLHTKIKWITSMRTDQTQDSLLARMKEAGLHLIMLGFESGNQDTLNSMSKRTTVQSAKHTMKAIKKQGILTLGLFMIGMPEETAEACRQTIRFAKELDCDMVKFNIVIPYPGTLLYEKYRDNIDPDCGYEDFTSWNTWLYGSKKLPLIPKHMTREELIKIQGESMFCYYMRPHVILRHLKLRMINMGDILFGGSFLLYKLFMQLLVVVKERLRCNDTESK